jgi:hypothetical protein
MQPAALHHDTGGGPPMTVSAASATVAANARTRANGDVRVGAGIGVVGLCRLNQVDPYPITYSLSNP